MKYFTTNVLDGRNVRLKLAYELLDVNPHKFVFAGKRSIRGIPAEVWIAEKIPDNPEDPYSTIEIFFADPKYTVQIEEVNDLKNVPLGMITHHASSISAPRFHTKIVNHYYHFTASPPHWKVIAKWILSKAINSIARKVEDTAKQI